MNSPLGFGSSELRFSLFFLFLAFLFHQALLALTNPDEPDCHDLFRCGNFTVGFPFWGDQRPAFCGHPHLELRCEKTQTTSLLIEDSRYILLQYSNTTRTLTLARIEHYFADSLCYLPFSNSTLDADILEYLPGYKNLTIYYYCDVSSTDPYSFTCGKVTDLISSGSSGFFSRPCSSSLNVPVPEDFDVQNPVNIFSRSIKVLKEGFKVKLKIDDKACRDCVSSGGICSFEDHKQICRSQLAHAQAATRKPFQRTKYIIVVVVLTSLAGLILVSIGFICYKRGNSMKAVFIKYKSRKATEINWKSKNVEALIEHKRYSYTQVKKMTKSFAHILGKGGFGSVYRGKLPNGRLVAVKVLTESKSTGEEFINEVASMSKTSHVNIVSLHGFCFEHSKRAIIYEFMVNGSLDKYISDKGSPQLDRTTLYGIALGVARGLEYLHNGCKTRIVHFDIKPQNILLDEEFCPKISDFGLAKLHEKRQSIISLLDARGTYGYIAPEVFYNNYGKPSHKSDVYSFGMLLLEMVGGRKEEEIAAGEPSSSNCDSAYFPDWIYKDLERGDGTARGWNRDEIDGEEDEMVRKMILVGLWCIQSSPLNRPPMSKVVEMMEGSLETLQIPPKPLLFCPATVSNEDCPWFGEDSSFSSNSRITQITQASARS